MNKRELKNRINESFLELAPDVYDQIVDAPIPELVLQEEPTWKDKLLAMFKKKSALRLVPVYVCLALVCVCYFGLKWNVRDDVYVMLDVNPSIRMKMNSSQEIESIQGLNADGKELVRQLEWEKNQTVGQVIDEVMGILCQQNVFQSENTVLVTIGESEDEKYEVLKESIQEELYTSIQEYGLEDVVFAFLQAENGEKHSGRDVLTEKLLDECGLSKEMCGDMSVEEMLTYYNERSIDKLETVKISEKKENAKEMEGATESTTQRKSTETTREESQENTVEAVTSESKTDEKVAAEKKTEDNVDSKNNTTHKENSTDNGKKSDSTKSTKANENSTKEKKTKTPNENSTKEKKVKKPNENSTKEKTTGTPNENSTKEKSTGNGNRVEKTTESEEEEE